MSQTADDQFKATVPVAAGSGTPAVVPEPARPPRFATVAELRPALQALAALPDHAHVYFGDGQLSFNRIVQHSDSVMQIEFNEIYAVTPDPTGG